MKAASMLKVIMTFLFCWMVGKPFGQAQPKLSTYLSTQYNRTLYDRTINNNPWGMGLGLQAFYNNRTKFRPTLELTADAYLEDDKVYYMGPADEPLPSFDKMINLFAGASFSLSKTTYLSFVAGPSFIDGKTLLGVKPSFGFYFSKSQRWTGKISYINVFNRFQYSLGPYGQLTADFGSLSVAMGIKLF